jgi:hypothetical protein
MLNSGYGLHGIRPSAASKFGVLSWRACSGIFGQRSDQALNWKPAAPTVQWQTAIEPQVRFGSKYTMSSRLPATLLPKQPNYPNSQVKSFGRLQDRLRRHIKMRGVRVRMS